MLNQSVLDRSVDRVFRALADPTRRALLERLSRGPASVSELSAPHDVSLAAILQHLQVLEDSGVVRTEKVGRVRTCAIEPGGLSVAERWLGERRSLWERRFDRLGDLLADEPATKAGAKRPMKRTTTKPSKEKGR